MSGAIPPLPLYALMEWAGKTLRLRVCSRSARTASVRDRTVP